MTDFHGWSDAALHFFAELEANNNRAWWLAHKAVYDDEVRAPFDALGDLIAEEFGPLRVFRPNHDRLATHVGPSSEPPPDARR